MNKIPEHILRELVLSGVNEFMYLSYDHDAAIEHAKKMGARPANNKFHFLSDNVKNKFPLWRKGKIREMDFEPDGTIKLIRVSNKYPYKKPYLPYQFGVDVKPIIFQSDDKYGLIKLDLACKNNEI